MTTLWSRLTLIENDRYYYLMNYCKPWLAWASLSKTKKALAPEPVNVKPTDMELGEMEYLSMKMWDMFRRCPWHGTPCECKTFPWQENSKIPARCNSLNMQRK